MTAKLHRIDLDVVSPDEIVDNLTGHPDVFLRRSSPDGASFPGYVFVGPLAALRAFAAEIFGLDDAEFDEFVEPLSVGTDGDDESTAETESDVLRAALRFLRCWTAAESRPGGVVVPDAPVGFAIRDLDETCRIAVESAAPAECGASYSTGGPDPYGTSCDLSPSHDGPHSGPDPFGGDRRIRWIGGGFAAGDPLPVKLIGSLLHRVEPLVCENHFGSAEMERQAYVPARCGVCGVGAVRAGDGTYVIRHAADCSERPVVVES